MDRRNQNNYLVRGYDNKCDLQRVHVERLKRYENVNHPAGELEIEEMLDVTSTADGGLQYLIKWRGMTLRYNAWIQGSNVPAATQIARVDRRKLEERHLSDDADFTNDELDPSDDAGAVKAGPVEKELQNDPPTLSPTLTCNSTY